MIYVENMTTFFLFCIGSTTVLMLGVDKIEEEK